MLGVSMGLVLAGVQGGAAQAASVCPTPSFAAATSFGAGDDPLFVTTGDFNADGKLDLAAANRSSHNISVLLGDGLGGFAAAVNFGADFGPLSVTTGDFNADGNLDLAVANLGPDNVSVLLGDGLGGFAAAVNFHAGVSPTAVTTGDFNADGKLDLGTANHNSNNVSVLLGNGLGGFAAATHFGAGNRPHSVTTGDFNADGKLDLATANLSGSVSVLLNTCTTNTPPTAVDDSYSTGEDTTLDVAARGVIGNDPDNENDTLTATLVSGPSHAASFSINPDGSFRYTPAANFNGPDSFTYKVSDSELPSNTAIVTITVNAVSDNPVATSDAATVAEDSGATTIAVLANDATTPDTGETLTVSSVTQGVNGAVAITGGGASVSYTPKANFNGADSFTYTISDGHGGSDAATVNVTVTLVNDAPTISVGGGGQCQSDTTVGSVFSSAMSRRLPRA